LLDRGIRISELNIDIPANLKAATVSELIDENGDWQVAASSLVTRGGDA
jgi:hypothetical protein